LKTQNHNTKIPKLAMAPVAIVCSTFVENILQIGLFLQNKPNSRESQIDVSLITTREYNKKSNRTLGENKPKQSQFSNDKRRRIFLVDY